MLGLGIVELLPPKTRRERVKEQGQVLGKPVDKATL